METQVFTFASSPFVPVAIGFVGLGTGYSIWGGQALFDFPKSSPEVNRTMGFWMQGFMQFLAGIFLLTGLTWFNVFGKATPLYMAASPSPLTAHSLVRDVLPAISRFQRPAGWLDGNSISVSQHSWR